MIPREPPKIEGDAPGLVWKPRKYGWSARWQARSDLILKGYSPKSVTLWFGTELSHVENAFIVSRCAAQQRDMLAWANNGKRQLGKFSGTIKSLIECYQMDENSPYLEKRYRTRLFYDRLCNRLLTDCGDMIVADFTGRDAISLHRRWSAGGKVAMGHALIGMLRGLFTFGKTILNDPACKEAKSLMHDMKFKMPKPRNERLIADQACAIRAEANRRGLHSIALAQAFQFDLMLRQKDVIGEYVPLSEPEFSTVTHGNSKWLRGLKASEINANLILTHITSKRSKEIKVDLHRAQMVMEEIAIEPLRTDGPLIISELHGRPWTGDEYRKHWRDCADAAGIPREVKNMDSRAGAITEATEAGVDLEYIRHAATHSDIGMTQRYARGSEEKTAAVMDARKAHRNKKATS